MYFQWSERLNTGITEIDNQHRVIADYINALYNAKQTDDLSEVDKVLAGLVGYTVNHFSFEEQLMEQAGYEFLRPHQRVHELFIKRIGEYRDRFSRGEDITDELLTLLKGWLGNHIEQEDRGYLTSVTVVTNDSNNNSWIAGLVKKIFR
ncbi:MAG: bacteriohemerythrin [Pseudomonadota bacterium]